MKKHIDNGEKPGQTKKIAIVYTYTYAVFGMPVVRADLSG